MYSNSTSNSAERNDVGQDLQSQPSQEGMTNHQFQYLVNGQYQIFQIHGYLLCTVL